MAQEEKTEKNLILTVTSSPHLMDAGTSKRIMFEVAFGTLPALGMAVYLFGTTALGLILACVATCVLTEAIFNAARGKRQTCFDGSVIVTGLILGLSLPPGLPIWAAVLGSVVATAVAKMLFGGLGSNIFNPAMVGRAFLMASFGLMMTTWQAPQQQSEIDSVSAATPLMLAKQAIKDAANDEIPAEQKATAGPVNKLIGSMFMGNVSGSAGETSALCWLIGGLFLLYRKTITWHIPVAVLGSALAFAAIAWLIDSQIYPNPLVHLCGGGLMMCAFFIATDPVSCPLSKTGRLVFGAGVGTLIMLIRLVGGYPEGVMYAILLMNMMTPLLDRWTRPRTMGGSVK